MHAELAPYLGESALHGRNDFEGYSTNRVYALLAKAPSVAELVEHPDVVALLDELLLPGYLLSANLAINLLPGETAQGLHTDDGFYRVPRPRPAIGVSAIWAIDDFTVRERRDAGDSRQPSMGRRGARRDRPAHRRRRHARRLGGGVPRHAVAPRRREPVELGRGWR